MSSKPLSLIHDGVSQATSLFPRAAHWGKALSKFVVVQLVVQAVNLASGILLVRTLSQAEYAYFTIANAMLSTMNILADSGIGVGVSAIGGRVWREPRRFGQLINTALGLRRRFAPAVALVVTPLLVWALVSKGASGTQAGVIALIVLLALACQLPTTVLMAVPRLHSQLGRIQAVDLLGAAVRLAFVGAACFIFLNAAVAVCATLLMALAQYAYLRGRVADSVAAEAPANAEDRAELLRVVKSYLANSIFFCAQGQLVVWLVSAFGSTQAVAEVGALGRLAVIFAVIFSVMTSVVLPGFSRCQQPARLRRRYWQIVGAFCLFGLSLIWLARLFPDQLLWILGAKYSHLRGELALMMTMTALGSVVTIMSALNNAKAWVRRSWLNIPCVLGAQALLLLLMDISTLHGALWFSILSIVPTFLLNAWLGHKGYTGRDADVRSS